MYSSLYFRFLRMGKSESPDDFLVPTSGSFSTVVAELVPHPWNETYQSSTTYPLLLR